MPTGRTRVRGNYDDATCQTCLSMDVNVTFAAGQKTAKAVFTLAKRTDSAGKEITFVRVRNQR